MNVINTAFTVTAQAGNEPTTDVPVIVFAVVILLVAGGMALWTHRRYRVDAPLSERLKRYRFRQRRLTIAAMMGIVGVMLLAGATVVNWVRYPELVLWFVLTIIGILVWVLILGICDLAAVLRLRLDLEKNPPRRTGD